MAEGLVNNLYKDSYNAHSAGTQPLEISPYAISVMKEIGIDISRQFAKSLDIFQDAEFDYVVTVCDDTSKACPSFLKGKKYINKSFKDPSKTKGKEDEIIGVFRDVRNEIKRWIELEFAENKML